MNQQIVLGIDGGGTYTRVVVANLKGNILGFSRKAGSHPGKNKDPLKNVNMAIKGALEEAKQPEQAIQYIVAGFAGLNEEKDKQWATDLLLNRELLVPTAVMNDAEIAQYGAFLGESGILAIAGTGSIVFGKTEKNKKIRNYNFHHDSKAAARYLAYSVIYEIISKNPPPNEQAFVSSVLHYWGVESIQQLRLLASIGFDHNQIDSVQKLSNMGRIVTSGAANGSGIAQRACHHVANSLITGIELVASMFSSNPVPLSLIGGVANHPFVKSLILKQLESNNFKQFTYSSPKLAPALGAILYAYHMMGIQVNEEVLNNLIYTNKHNNFF
ncbi:BadF/BadG/BcrA/BcrD ATPase family protein [Bacillus sp. JJ1532]|uniref:BadF/BadG/BcrA/BcrD ATPase family protein n=1 Tax=Bacillus sp. JJ1532 TaxID=3122958 RepID=UPI002FFFFE0A